MLRNAGVAGMSDDPASICTGSNSGHQAINIASLAGGNPIVLVGYDAKPNKQGRHHFFGDHPDKTQAPYQNMIREARIARKFFDENNIEVLNANPDSALDAFEKTTLEEALCP